MYLKIKALLSSLSGHKICSDVVWSLRLGNDGQVRLLLGAFWKFFLREIKEQANDYAHELQTQDG